MSGWYMVVAECAACGEIVSCNPQRVPSMIPPGSSTREPICENCFHRWNELHRTSKGLEPEPLHPEAYGPAPESDMDREPPWAQQHRTEEQA